MLLDRETLEGIRAGTVAIQFRRWRRPTVRTGGRLLTAIGQLRIHAVDRVDAEAITPAEARAAGWESADALRERLDARPDGDVYRIELSLLGPDPRVALRESVPEGKEAEALRSKLDRLDARASEGAWTRGYLELIEARPGERAADLAGTLRCDRNAFKTKVRKLKSLGLTESLAIGYRLSPRGEAVLTLMRGGEESTRGDTT